MSRIALSGNPSGSGTLTIASPNTNSDVTINLPTVTGGDFIVSNASGNVGIGTSSPGARAELSSAATDFTGLILNNTSTNGKRYNLVSAGSGGYFDVPIGGFGIRDLTAGATRMAIDTAGTLILNQGQIQFPATQNPSSNANTLDDYEEGTWTPSLSGNATYLQRNGFYIKVGRFVWLKFILQVNVLGTGSSTTITGLPFVFSNDGGPRSSGACNYFASLLNPVTSISWNVDVNGIFAGTTNASTTAIADGPAIFSNSTYVMGSVTYTTTN
jgi:hypothetical protein